MFNEVKWRRLRDHIAGLPADAFHYGRDNNGRSDASCGCVAHYAALLCRRKATGSHALLSMLEVGIEEAIYLYGGGSAPGECEVSLAIHVEPAAQRMWSDNPLAAGSTGRQEALRRLDFVAARYGVTSEIPWTDDDKRFMAALAAFSPELVGV